MLKSNLIITITDHSIKKFVKQIDTDLEYLRIEKIPGSLKKGNGYSIFSPPHFNIN